MNRFYETRSTHKIFQVEVIAGEDNFIRFTPQDNKINFGSLIMQYGGKEEFLKNCVESELSYEEYSKMRKEQYQRAVKNSYAAQQKKWQEKEERDYNESAVEYAELQEKYKGRPIDCTPKNLLIIMKYLNARNWGSWELPMLTQGYTALQHDCGGKQATTIKLDKGIEVQEGCRKKTYRRFKYGAPTGYLITYMNIQAFAHIEETMINF